MAQADQPFVVLGVISGAHGVRGEVRIKSFTAEPGAIADYGPLMTRDGRTFELTGLRPAKAGFVARIKGVSDRTQAEGLKRTELGLPRDRLPEPDAEEFYHGDLIGMRAELADGTMYGEVIAVHDFGAGNLLEIRLEGSHKTELVAFTKATVPVVDIENHKVIVVPPFADEDDVDELP